LIGQIGELPFRPRAYTKLDPDTNPDPLQPPVVRLAGLSVREEVPQHHDLDETDQDDGGRFQGGPDHDPLIEILGPLATLRLTQSMMRLGVQDIVEALVNRLGGRLHLRQHRGMLVHTRQSRFLAHLEVHVDDLVREGRELIAKAGGIHARRLGHKLMAIEGGLLQFVDDLALRILQGDVHIQLATGRHLELEVGARVLLDLLVEAVLCIVGQIEGEFHGRDAVQHEGRHKENELCVHGWW